MSELSRRLHLDARGPHQCCYSTPSAVALGEVLSYRQCGLMCGHRTDHVAFDPGVYLPAPLVHPLDLLVCVPRGLCPSCKFPWISFEYCPPTVVFTENRDWGLEVEVTYAFAPCGCVVREILEGEDASL